MTDGATLDQILEELYELADYAIRNIEGQGDLLSSRFVRTKPEDQSSLAIEVRYYAAQPHPVTVYGRRLQDCELPYFAEVLLLSRHFDRVKTLRIVSSLLEPLPDWAYFVLLKPLME